MADYLTPISWTLNDGVLTISGTGAMDNYDSDGAPWYESRRSITSIVIENGVTSIGTYAFSSCVNAINVTIPNSVKNIYSFAFYSCESLTNIIIPDSVTSIGSAAFAGCILLTNVTIGSNVTSIGQTAFNGCTALTSITIPNSVTSIGSFAFYNCTSLDNIIIPDSVTIINDSTFRNCTSLANITIPDSVTSISDNAFDGCSSLTNVYYTGSGTEWIAIAIGSNNDPLLLDSTTIHYNYNPIIASGYCGGEDDGTNLSWTLTDNGVFTISGTGVMEDYSADNLPWYENGNAITSVIIENGVTTIGSSAFYSCTALENITIPNSVTSIGSYAFCNCTKLTSMMIPNNVTNIGGGAFWYCTTLTSITIPNSVTNIGDAAFEGSIALTDVYYTGSETDWNMITIGIQNKPLLNATKHYGSSSTNITYLVTKAELTSMANAIRAKAGTTSKYTWPNQMISAIEGLTIGSVVDWTGGGSINITSDKVLSDTYFYDDTGTLTYGNIPVQEPVSTAGFTRILHPSEFNQYGYPSITFAPGYYGRSHKLGLSSGSSITITPSITSQTITLYGSSATYSYFPYAITIESAVTTENTDWISNRLAISETYSNSTITKIDSGAFAYCSNLTQANFPQCKTIECKAFYDCIKLASINFPQCTKIDFEAFRRCSNLTQANFPQCKTISYSAFYSCINLISISFPQCTSIGFNAFTYCKNLTSANFSLCTSIGASAFYKCINLTSINFLQCTIIDYSAFQYCSSLTAADFPRCTSIASNAFYGCTNLASINFPQCTTISYSAFYCCSNLTSANFPQCTKIGPSAFAGCQRLKTLILSSSEIVTLAATNAFNNTPISTYTTYTNGVNGSIYVPASLVSAYKSATNWVTYSNRITSIRS